jgi:hypothetical protein
MNTQPTKTSNWMGVGLALAMTLLGFLYAQYASSHIDYYAQVHKNSSSADEFSKNFFATCRRIIDGDDDIYRCACVKDRYDLLDKADFNKELKKFFGEGVSDSDLERVAPACYQS